MKTTTCRLMPLPEQTYRLILSAVKSGMTIRMAARTYGYTPGRYYDKVSPGQKEAIMNAKKCIGSPNNDGLTKKDIDTINRFCARFDAITKEEVIQHHRLRPALAYCIMIEGNYWLMPLAKILGEAWGVRVGTIKSELYAFVDRCEKDPYLRKIVRDVCGG